MSVVAVILGIEKVIGLIQVGLTSLSAVTKAVEDGKLAVKNASGQEMSSADVASHVDAAIAESGKTGDAAAGRVDRRQRE